MTEDRRADRAVNEAHRIDGKCLQHAYQRVGFGKEEFAEDQPGDDAVKQEIVPLDRRANGAGDYRPAKLRAMVSLR